MICPSVHGMVSLSYELVELNNAACMNIQHRNCDKLVRGLWHFICGERRYRVENNSLPTTLRRPFWILSKLVRTWAAPAQIFFCMRNLNLSSNENIWVSKKSQMKVKEVYVNKCMHSQLHHVKEWKIFTHWI